ncbi:MAG: helix-turn-helix domain-containing protein [Egibacteraceae bacterium]
MSRHLIVVTEAMLRRLAKGWRVDQLAERVEAHFPTARGLDGKAVGKWERRFRVPREDYADALCEELDAAALELLGIGRSLEAQAYWRLATAVERDADVRRRELLKDGFALAGAVALLPVDRLTKWANFYGQAQRVDAGLLGELEGLSTQIAQKYAAGETATALPAARAQAYAVTQLLDRAVMTCAQRDRLGSIGADAAAMQGVLALNMGLPDEAASSMTAALDLARTACDPRLEALVTATETWLWSPGSLGVARATRDPQQAVSAMAHACALGRHAPPPALVWLHAFHGRDLAAAGDATGSARAHGRAMAALDGVAPDESGWGFFSLYGELGGFADGRIHASEGDARLRLGQHADAIDPLQRALEHATMPPIKRGIIGERLVEAWTGAGEPEPACAAGISCLDQADATGFALGVEKVRDVRATFPKDWADLACVQELDARLRALA